MASAHQQAAVYEYDRDAVDLRQRVELDHCRACRAGWPCLAERGRRIAAAAVPRERERA